MRKVNNIRLFLAAFLLFALPVGAQDTAPMEETQVSPQSAVTIDDGTNILGTIIDQQLGTASESEPNDDFIMSEEDENNFIDPDFLKDDVKAYDDYPKVTVRILDKITADTRTYDLEIGKTVAYGALRIRPKACKKTPPIEEPESASFLQIWEKMTDGKDQWVYSGWMFASSPSLAAMEHPVYDVWVIDCKN